MNMPSTHDDALPFPLPFASAAPFAFAFFFLPAGLGFPTPACHGTLCRLTTSLAGMPSARHSAVNSCALVSREPRAMSACFSSGPPKRSLGNPFLRGEHVKSTMRGRNGQEWCEDAGGCWGLEGRQCPFEGSRRWKATNSMELRGEMEGAE